MSPVHLSSTTDRKPGQIADPQSAERLSVLVEFAYNYLLYVPDDYAPTDGPPWPLVIFLHGHGERGTDLELIKKNGLPRLIASGRKFPFIVVSPQCPDTEWWNTIAVDAFIGEVSARYHVDLNRVYLTGLSMGGFGTWAAAMHRPDRYAAIVPICGGGETQHAAALCNLAVWAFHGAKDGIVLPKRSAEMIDAIKAAGGAPRYTVYPEVGHSAWEQAYADNELYAWLLSQRRGAPAASPLS